MSESEIKRPTEQLEWLQETVGAICGEGEAAKVAKLINFMESLENIFRDADSPENDIMDRFSANLQGKAAEEVAEEFSVLFVTAVRFC